MSRPSKVSEELAQLRNTRQMVFYLAECIERRDKDLADHLARVVAGQQALDRKLDQAVNLVEQYTQTAERARLESHGCVVQLLETTRIQIDEQRKVPALTANAVAVAVGTALGQEGVVPVIYLVPAPTAATGEPIRLVPPGDEELAA